MGRGGEGRGGEGEGRGHVHMSLHVTEYKQATTSTCHGTCMSEMQP